jgi:hypothetical protein
MRFGTMHSEQKSRIHRLQRQPDYAVRKEVKRNGK